MDRGTRRTRTERKVKQRIRDVRNVAPSLLKRPDLVGQSRSRHPLDCGHPQCTCCHSAKVFKIPKVSDLRRQFDE